MFSTDISQIIDKVNRYTKENKSFLFAINFEMTEGFFIENPLDQSEVLFQVKDRGNKVPHTEKGNTVQFMSNPLSYIDYKQKFDIVHDSLKRGYSYLTNLTLKTPVTTNLSLEDIFARSNAPYKLLVPGHFVCFSPERFVKIADGIISTNPMKGTIDATLTNAEQIILEDFKETAEHNTIVDLLRNDLSMVADHVKVNRFRYIDRIKTNKKDILQVSSEIIGKLNDYSSSNLGDVIFSMLPAGSISGAPKDATLRIIEEAESEKRGYYTGVFGYFDGEEFDSAVIIRFIEEQRGEYYFRSGGGITVYSDAESEYKEVLSKIYLPI